MHYANGLRTVDRASFAQRIDFFRNCDEPFGQAIEFVEAARCSATDQAHRPHSTAAVLLLLQRKTLSKCLVTRRLEVRHSVHPVPQLRQLEIHAATRAALVTQGAVLGDAVPGVVGEALGKIHLRG